MKTKTLPTYIFWITTAVYLLAFFTVVFYYEHQNNYSQEFTFNKVSFNKSLDQKTIDDVFLIVGNVKPEYRNTIKSIYVSKDISEIGEKIWGVNRNGHIRIRYVNSEQFKLVLAHEIAHNFAKNEDFCDQVAKKGWCYQ